MKKSLPPTNRSLPIALIRARENVMGPIRAMLHESGLTEQQWRVLRVLSESGKLDATELSERACLLLPSLSRILRTMDNKGLISRGQNSEDRRRQKLEITAAGQSIIDANMAQGIVIVERMKAHLGPGNYEQLLTLLEALAARPVDPR